MLNQINSIEEYNIAYKASIENPETFWDEIANTFVWRKKFSSVLEWNFTEPKIEWFKDGKLNITDTCIEQHANSTPEKIAIIWEPNDPNENFRTLTYLQLFTQVKKCANVLIKNGICKGDKVCIYMPMVPEAAVAMLACARIGAIHSVVFAGFSAQSLRDRINDSSCKLIITADAVYRGSKLIELKKIVDEALLQCPSIKTCLVLNHRNISTYMKSERDKFWNDEMQNVSDENEAEIMDAESPLFILYTSGSTGKPKGLLHTTAGYMVYTAYTFKNVFNYKPDEIYCCTADIGWITGHSYIIYGPLANGATTLMFEGIPTYPDHGRFWDIIDKHNVNIFYTAPTAIRSLEAFGTDILENKNLSSLRVLGTVGEPINEEAWNWYFENIGKKNCPIVDTWWQTETGGILISPIAHVTKIKPAFATLPLPGIQPVLVDENGNEIIENNVEGNLCIKFPWPGIARSIYGNHERFKSTYFSDYPNMYFTGDGSKRDEDGYYRITGRVDDIIKVSGHRIGTGEVEDAINMHDCVVESAVVGFPHEIKGQGIYAFIICNKETADAEKIKNEIKIHVSNLIGSFAKPEKIQIVTGLPKTRSGKIMRRILRKIADGEKEKFGDISTLLDPNIVEKIISEKK